MRINSQGWSLAFSIRIIVITCLILDKVQSKKKYKLMSSQQRQDFILKNMESKTTELGSGFPNKNYDSEEVYELTQIANYFPEIR